MILRIDFYKDSGKWYSGGDLDIPDGANIWDSNFKQLIVDNQKTMADGWQNHGYYVIIGNHYGGEISPNFKGFHKRLFNISSFKDMKKYD